MAKVEVTFDAVDSAFAGTMRMEVTFEAEADGTRVSMLFQELPPGIRPEDNEAGTRSAMEKLARYVERGPVAPLGTASRE